MKRPTFSSRPKAVALTATLVTSLVALHAQSSSAGGRTIRKLETGVSYSRGDYGLPEDTEVFVVPSNYVHEKGPWAIRLTVPWLHLTGPAAIVSNGGGAVGGPSRPNDASASGLGDALLGLTYKTNPNPTGAHLDFTGKVKLPTGDEARGLGTGEIDTQVQVDYYESFNGKTPFLNAGYRVLGDGLYQLEDGFYASGGLAVQVADGTSMGASLDWRESIVRGGDDSVETTVFAYRRHSAAWSTTIYGQKGFTNASPDFGAGVSFSFGF